ncbi:MAG: ribosome small subunit-dependent GTPase A [Tidjanibacter sp.]|nr:ribosome small subunit-dependent GTPase A [Tidjanibacter sp.]MBR6813803.1 ribosome small subunit-dependent GTPase A [Tidjanibacter sp.]MBR7103116.1 ribosome small subunit-dependent GTPase A [Tidjanibacter sp.]
MAERGTVIESTGSWYKVLTAEGQTVECRIRGRIRLDGRRSTNPVVVGDEVEWEIQPDGVGVITQLSPRRNYIIRRASNLSKESHIIAANIDQAFIVVTLFDPPTNREFIDRYLVTCEAYHIPAIIVLNKVDLARREAEMLADFLESYHLAGYPVICTSAAGGEGVEQVRELCKGRTSLFSGNSGVGKSTLIRAIEPSADAKVGEISKAHHKGRHTTTFSHVYPLTGGGAIIDTPGIKGFGLIDIDSDELCRYFPDFMREAPECGFYNCTHTHEPSCAVVRAVEEGRIAYSRYESYLKIMDEDGKYR